MKQPVTPEDLKEMGQKNTICEAVMNVKEALEVAYPNSVFMIVATDWHINPETGKPQKYQIAAKKGDQRDLSIETTHISESTPWLADTCTETALNIITSHTPQRISAKPAAILHDAAIDYGKWVGLNVEGFEYCRDSAKWRDKLAPKPASAIDKASDPTIHKIGQKVTPAALEQHITQVRQELKRLEAMRDVTTMRKMISDEIKRLKRKNELTAAKTLQDELDAYEASQARKQQLREQRIERLKAARQALAEKREKRRRAKQNPPQPNFAKMAKQKRQQIAARQAEKKKKKAAGSGANQVSSCSQLLNR